MSRTAESDVNLVSFRGQYKAQGFAWGYLLILQFFQVSQQFG